MPRYIVVLRPGLKCIFLVSRDATMFSNLLCNFMSSCSLVSACIIVMVWKCFRVHWGNHRISRIGSEGVQGCLHQLFVAPPPSVVQSCWWEDIIWRSAFQMVPLPPFFFGRSASIFEVFPFQAADVRGDSCVGFGRWAAAFWVTFAN